MVGTSTKATWKTVREKLAHGDILAVVSELGHKFVPAWRVQRKQLEEQIDGVVDETCRKIGWKVVFEHEDPNKAWKEPPFGYISTGAAPQLNTEKRAAVERVCQGVKEKVRKQLDERFDRRRTRALDAHEVQRVKENSNVRYVMADKNLGVFAVTEQQYQSMQSRELSNYEKDTLTEGDRIQYLLKLSRECATDLRGAGLREQAEFVTRWMTREERRGTFKRLPRLKYLVKAHKLSIKSRDLTQVPDLLPYRPILPYVRHPLYAVGKVLAQVLNEIVELFPWVLKDSQGALKWLESMGEKRTNIDTADATNLFGSIPPQAAIEALHEALQRPVVRNLLQKRHSGWLKVVRGEVLLIRVARVVVLNTYLAADSTEGVCVFRQNGGMPMGAPPVPPLANLVLALVEVKQLSPEQLVAEFKRYVDDIATVDCGRSIVYPPFVKLTWKKNPGQFLDLQWDRHSITVHHKEFDADPPHVFSRVPNSFKKNYFKGALVRAVRVCSSEQLFNTEKERLKLKGMKAGYSQEWLSHTCDAVQFHRDREVLRTNKMKQRKGGELVIVQRVSSVVDINVLPLFKEALRSEQVPQLKMVRARQVDKSLGALLCAEKHRSR